MSKTIKIRDKTVDRVNELVSDPYDELTWPEKITQVVDKARAFDQEVEQ